MESSMPKEPKFTAPYNLPLHSFYNGHASFFEISMKRRKEAGNWHNRRLIGLTDMVDGRLWTMPALSNVFPRLLGGHAHVGRRLCWVIKLN